jgi:GT2 family glycosyltransferase
VGEVTAIVVCHDSAHALPACLDALNAQRVPTIVVDNASADGSAALAEARGARALRLACNEGYGRANNRGVAAAGTPFALILNPDVILEPGAATALVAAAERFPDAAILGPRLFEADGRVFFQPRSHLASYLPNPGGRLAVPEGEACTPFVSGACLLVRRDVFLQLGGFDPNIFLFYEDDDLCRRVADAGRSIIYVPRATARHGRGRSSAPAPGRIFRSRWHQAWSKAYVSQKYGLPDTARAMLALNAPKALAATLTLRRSTIERYAGSAAGALAFLRGETALSREGLAP